MHFLLDASIKPFSMSQFVCVCLPHLECNFFEGTSQAWNLAPQKAMYYQAEADYVHYNGTNHVGVFPMCKVAGLKWTIFLYAPTSPRI